MFRRTLDRCDALADAACSIAAALLDLLYSENERQDGGASIDQTGYTQARVVRDRIRAGAVVAIVGRGSGCRVGPQRRGICRGLPSPASSISAGRAADDRRARTADAGAASERRDVGAVYAGNGGSRVAPLLEPFRTQVSIAAVNGPRTRSSCPVMARRHRIDSPPACAQGAEGTLPGMPNRLNVSHAFHSPLMEPNCPRGIYRLGHADARQLPTAAGPADSSNSVTGREAGEEIRGARLLGEPHSRRRRAGFPRLQSAPPQQMGCEIFLEAGPQPVLCGLGRQSHCHPATNRLAAQPGTPNEARRLGADAGQRGRALASRLAARRSTGTASTAEYPRRRGSRCPPIHSSGSGTGSQPRRLARRRRRRAALRPAGRKPADAFAAGQGKPAAVCATLGVATQLPISPMHKVHDELVVPGAAYLAMLASGAELLGWPSCRPRRRLFSRRRWSCRTRKSRTLHRPS